MKYWNKKRAIASWTPVRFGMNPTAKVWCQRNGSACRFHIKIYSSTWLFENSEDALAFKLTWAVQKV